MALPQILELIVRAVFLLSCMGLFFMCLPSQLICRAAGNYHLALREVMQDHASMLRFWMLAHSWRYLLPVFLSSGLAAGVMIITEWPGLE